jgi:hypothetical protein
VTHYCGKITIGNFKNTLQKMIVPKGSDFGHQNGRPATFIRLG